MVVSLGNLFCLLLRECFSHIRQVIHQDFRNFVVSVGGGRRGYSVHAPTIRTGLYNSVGVCLVGGGCVLQPQVGLSH